jgi:hypothetical protein
MSEEEFDKQFAPQMSEEEFDKQFAPPKAETPLKSFVRAAAHEVVPTVAGIGTSFLGAPAWAAGPVAGIGAMAATGMAGYTAAKAAQESVLPMIGMDDSQQLAINAQTNPKTTFAGELAPQLLGFGPGMARAGAGALERIAPRILGGGFMGGMEAGREYLAGEDLSPYKLALSAGTGAALTRPWGVTPFLESQAARLGPRFRLPTDLRPSTEPWTAPGVREGTAEERMQAGLPSGRLGLPRPGEPVEELHGQPTSPPTTGMMRRDYPPIPEAEIFGAGRSSYAGRVREHAYTIHEQGGRVEDNPYPLGTRAYEIWDRSFKSADSAATDTPHGAAGSKAQASVPEPPPPTSKGSATQEPQNQTVRDQGNTGKYAKGAQAARPQEGVNQPGSTYADKDLERALAERNRAEGAQPAEPGVPPTEPGGPTATGGPGAARPAEPAARPPEQPAPARPLGEPEPTAAQRAATAPNAPPGSRAAEYLAQARARREAREAAEAAARARPEEVPLDTEREMPAGFGKPKPVTEVDVPTPTGTLKFSVSGQSTLGEMLGKYKKSPGLFGKVADFVRSKVSDLVGHIPVYTAPYENFERWGLEKVGAFYDPMRNHIVVSDLHLDKPDIISHHILHEGLHAATYNGLEKSPELRGVLRDIMNDVIIKKMPSRREKYGFTNEHEFLAEGFSNPEFRQRLAEHQLSPDLARSLSERFGNKIKTAWDAFINTIRETLGLPPNRTSALEALLRATEQAMAKNVVEPTPHVARRFMPVEEPRKPSALDEALVQAGFRAEDVARLGRFDKGKIRQLQGQPEAQRAAFKEAMTRAKPAEAPPAAAAAPREAPPATPPGAPRAQPTPKGFFGKAQETIKKTWRGITDPEAIGLANNLFKLRNNAKADSSYLQELQAKANEKFPNITPEMREQMYHEAERGEQDKWTGEQKQYWEEHLKPIQEENLRLRQEMKDMGYDKEVELSKNHMYRMVNEDFKPQDVTSDPTQNYKGRGFKIEPGTRKQRDYFVLEDADGNRRVIGRNETGDRFMVYEAGNVPHPTGLSGNIKRGSEVKVGGKEYTVKDALTSEIEANTPTRYIKDVANSYLNENYQMRQAVDAARFLKELKESAMWKERATTTPTDLQRKAGWEESNIPQLKGWHMTPEWKATFDDFYKPGFGGGAFDWLRNVNNFAVGSMFWSPIPHSVNAIVHWGIARGWDWFKPEMYAPMYHTLSAAYRSVMSQDALQRELLRDGTSLIYAGMRNDHFENNIAKALQLSVKNDPGWDPMRKAFGISPVDAVKAVYAKSKNILWATNDILMTSRILELRDHHNKSLQEAIQEARVHMPDYRIPIEIFGSRAIAQAIADNRLVLFGRYHYGMLNSLGHIARDTLSPNATKEERMAAFGNVAAMAAIGVIGMGMTKLLQFATDNEHAEVRPRGPYPVLRAGLEFAQGKTGYERLWNSVVSWQPTLSMVRELTANQDYFGKPIVEPGTAPLGVTKKIAHHIAHGLVSPYATVSDAARARPSPAGVVGGAAQMGLGVKVPSGKKIAGEQAAQARQRSDVLKRERRPRGLIEQIPTGGL